MTSTPSPAASEVGLAPARAVSRSLRPGWGAFLAFLTCLLWSGCSSAPPFDARAIATEWVAYMQRDYVLRPGDRLSIRVDDFAPPPTPSTESIQEVVVSPTGSIDLRNLPVPLQVGGKSVGALRTLVTDAYKGKFEKPSVSISLVEASAQTIYVCGEVFRPGPVVYQPGMTMTQAIASAGSFIHTVKHTDIRILRIHPDGTQRTTRVNMDAVLLDEQPDFLLLPGDVVYAQTSGIADAGNWVDLWIRRLLPFQLGGPAIGTISN